jgi:uncharacterized protein YhaN
MRIKKIHIDGFGCYRDKSFGSLDEPLTIFSGPNEAGKTTFLEFIRMVLFGFPLRGSTEHFPPLDGGKHGGRLEVVTDEGKSFTVERHQGKKGGLVSIRDADGTPVAQSPAVLSKLLGQVSKSTFESVFAFDLDDLQKLDSEISPTSVGAVKLPSALKQLKENADKLYKPSGSKQPVAEVLAELLKVKDKLGEVRSQAEDYRSAESKTKELVKKIAADEEDLSRVRATVEELTRRRGAWSDWNAFQEVEESLSKIPDRPDFPDDPIGRLDGFEKQCEESDQDVVRKDRELKLVLKTAEGSVAGEELLGESTALEEIAQGRTSFDNSVRDLPIMKLQLNGHRNELTQALKDLGTGWDEKRLKALNTSLPQRDEFNQFKTRLSLTGENLRDCVRDVEQKKRVSDEADQQVQDAQDRVQENPSTQTSHDVLSKQRTALRTARTRRNEFDQAETRCRDLEKQLSGEHEPRPSFWRFALSVALGGLGVVSVGGGVVADEVVFLWMGGALMVGAAAAYAYALRRLPVTDRTENPNLSGLIQEARSDAQEKKANYLASVEPLKPHLESEQLPGPDKLDAVETALNNIEEVNRDQAELVKKLNEATKGAQRAALDCEKTESQRTKLDETDHQAREDWSAWLTQQKLSENLLPDTVIEMFSRADVARGKLGEIDETEKRIKAMEENIDTYSSKVKTVAARHLGSSVDADDSATVVAQVAEIHKRFKQVQSDVNKRDEAKRAATKCKKDLDEATDRQKTARKRFNDLLSHAETEDPEEFRRRAQQHLERQRLEKKRAEYVTALLAAWRREKKLEELINAFKSTTKQNTDDELRQFESKQKDLETRISENREEKGRNAERTELLLNDEDADRQYGRYWELIERLRELATEWSKLTLTHSLLERARTKYEEESQPDVVRHAGKVFSDLTCGKYSKLRVPLGEQAIFVFEEETRREKTEDQLSRATREQLYLAVRLGIIQQMAEHVEHLPLIVDEVFVNSDPERARRIVQAFVERSHDNQVIILTCHPWVRNIFDEVAPTAPQVELKT